MIDDYQRQLRKRFIGSSDAAAVCGISPWASAWDVWAEKTGRAPGFAGNEMTEAGTYLERGCIDWLSNKLGMPITTDQSYVAADEIRACNMDGLILSQIRPESVEIKTVGLFGGRGPDSWGDTSDGGEGIPPEVLIQTHHQFGVLDSEFGEGQVSLCHVVAFVAGRGFCHYRVRRNDSLVKSIIDTELSFWNDFVIANQPPSDSKPSRGILKSLVRVPGLVVPVDQETVHSWLAAKEIEKAAVERRKELEAAVLVQLGDAEGGDLGEMGSLTYFETERDGYTVQPTRYRTLRFKPVKQLKSKKQPQIAAEMGAE